MNFLQKIIIFVKRFFHFEEEVNPNNFGWQEKYKEFYTKSGGWFLYRSQVGGWVLDKEPKYGPGVVARIPRLIEMEIEFVNNMTLVKNPHRFLKMEKL